MIQSLILRRASASEAGRVLVGVDVAEDWVTGEDSGWLEIPGGVNFVDDAEAEVTRPALGDVEAVDGTEESSD